MRAFFRHPFTEWIIMILAIMAGIIAIKFLLSYLPDGGFMGAIKSVGLSA